VDTIVVVLKFVITVNFAVSLVYGVKMYKATKSHTWLFLCMSLGTAFLLSSIRFTKEFFYLHYDQFEPYIIVFELVKVTLIPFVTAFLLATAITLSRERIAAVLPAGTPEETTSRSVREGSLYLIKERVPENGLKIFLNLISHGYEGLCIVRTYPDDVKKKYAIGTIPVWWMSSLHTGKYDVVHPNVTFLEQRIEEILEHGKRVIFLERLDYLISQQGFRKTIRFIQWLSSLVSVTKSIALVHIDPQTLPKRQLVLIEKETKVLEESLPKLEEELMRVLTYVYEKNEHGIKPNIGQLARDLFLSRNTANKRLESLKNKNFIDIRKKGRGKILEITEIGKNFFHKTI
jgi:DNA-binding MarR family transcriptional regulator